MTQSSINSGKELRTGAAYIRVSTDDQLELSPDSQLAEIRAYCARNQILLPQEYIFIENDGVSGRKSQNRTAFLQMIATAKTTPKPFDGIVLWKFSRFARNQDESTFYKSLLRKKLNIDVVSINEPLIEGMYGRLMEMIIEWNDEFYSVNLSNEVTRSMRYKAEHGYYNGKVPLGYHKEPNAVPVIVESEAHIVRTIFQLFTAGYDKNYIVRYLNDHQFKTRTGKTFDIDGVNYILENPFYIGKIRWNRRQSSGGSKLRDPSEWIIADSYHEPIIDADTWDAAQQRLIRIKETHTRYAHPVSHGKHWLSGMVKCSVCGKSLSYKAPSHQARCRPDVKSGEGFQCLGYRRGLHRDSQFISERKLTAAVTQSLRQVLEAETPCSFSLIRSVHNDLDLEKQIYERELVGLEKKENRIREAYMNEIDTLEEYKNNRAMIARRREELNSLLAALQAPSQDPVDYQEEFLRTVRSVLELIESDVSYELKGEALRSIVQQIIFHKDTNTLEFHYIMTV